MFRLRLLPLVLLAPSTGLGASLPAVPLDGITVELRPWHGATWEVVTVDLEVTRLRLVGQAEGDPHRLGDLPDTTLVATNAGIFESPEEPSGWFVEDGVEHHPVNHGTGKGNFYLPNGAFWVDEAGAALAPTAAIAPLGAVELATQSGPLLRWHGVDSPAIDPSWKGRGARNFVAVRDETHVVFAATHDQVTLGETLAFARDGLAVDDALYLDGTISELCTLGACAQSSRTYAGLLVVTR